MNVSVRFSAPLAQLVGTPRLGVTLAEGATVADLIDHLSARYPQLARRLSLSVAVAGGRTVPNTEPLVGGEEVAFLMPVAGGS